jgi:hypothetical protein
MSRRIKTPADLAWLLEHTQAFYGGHIHELTIRKRRVFDETSGRDIVAGTDLTAMIRYQVTRRGLEGPYVVTRMAKLTMRGVTDLSIFEQDGADCSEIHSVHAEAIGGRLRFWFDPRGEFYVVCDEVEFEEVSRPGPTRSIRTGISEWAFQAHTGNLPTVEWLLAHLDRAGLPCTWRPVKRAARAHPTLRWEGYLVPADQDEPASPGSVHVQLYGGLDNCQFGITLRAADPHEHGTGRLLLLLADIIARHFPGICLSGNQIVEGEEWLAESDLSRRAACDELTP